jgi:ankyrin repeat protein
MVKLLIKKGSDILVVAKDDRWTLLNIALSNGHLDVVKLLLEKGQT